MEIQLWWTGKNHFDYIKDGIADYVQRLSHFCKFKVVEFPSPKGVKDIHRIQTLEEIQLIKNLRAADFVVLLDEKGKQYESVAFAHFVEQLMHGGHSRIIFIIGGAYGFSDDFKKRANQLLSFSKFTFSHQLIRLLFAEQLYRAFTIINHLPYHHE